MNSASVLSFPRVTRADIFPLRVDMLLILFKSKNYEGKIADSAVGARGERGWGLG